MTKLTISCERRELVVALNGDPAIPPSMEDVVAGVMWVGACALGLSVKLRCATCDDIFDDDMKDADRDLSRCPSCDGRDQ